MYLYFLKLDEFVILLLMLYLKLYGDSKSDVINSVSSIVLKLYHLQQLKASFFREERIIALEFFLYV